MYVACLLIFLLLGFHIGSFLAVVADRVPKHEDFLFGRSHCNTCGHELKFYELIPIISYLIQKGRCRHCGNPISKIFLFSEIITGFLFMLSFYIFGFSYELLIALGLVSLFVIVLGSDITYLIIPDSVIIFFIIYFLIIQFLNEGIIRTGLHILTSIFLFFVMYFIMILGNKIFKKESMGGADIKIMFIFGLILDPFLGCVTIFLGSFIALPVSIFLLLSKKEHIIPFGPFLTAALLIVYLLQINTASIIKFLGI